MQKGQKKADDPKPATACEKNSMRVKERRKESVCLTEADVMLVNEPVCQCL